MSPEYRPTTGIQAREFSGYTLAKGWTNVETTLALGNANPEGIFQTRVYGFGGLQTRVPGYPGLT